MDCFRYSSRAFGCAVLMVLVGCTLTLGQTPQPGSNPQSSRAVGTIKNAQPEMLIVTQDAGGEITANLSSETKILRVPPGDNDLMHATAIQAQDLQPGDRVLVRGQSSADGKSIAARAVIVMKQADVSAKQDREREDWQKRGVGGPVTDVDAASGTITISSPGTAGNRNLLIHTTKATKARRYAPDSVKFDDARPASVDQVRVGDQLRARGTRSADGNEVAADEIVFGSFRNIAGTIANIDPASNSITVQDVMAKAPVVVKITRDSQIKKLPAEMAQRIATRMKGGTTDAAGQSAAGAPSTQATRSESGAAKPWGGTGGAQGTRGGSGNGGGALDLQRFLGRMPASALTDLNKGDAVMIVATQGSDPGNVTAITVLSGVEPILTASPNRTMTLSPWTLGAGEGDSAP
jgi:Domain of unknown function (DUF5666)